MLPTEQQIEVYKICGYLNATSRFQTRHRVFERWCEMSARPLVIIWPFSKGRRRITMQLFHCTDSILDDEFRSSFKNLSEIWGASSCQSKSLPIEMVNVKLKHAKILAGYLHQLAIDAYKRRATKVKRFLVIEGPPSDGKPKTWGGPFGGGCVFTIPGWRDLDCILELDNGERYKTGFKGMKEPELEYVQDQFANQPGIFRLLNSP